MNLEKIIEFIIPAVIGGCFTLICTFITEANKNKKEKREEERRIFKEKPKFSVRKADDNEKADVQVFIAPFECVKNEDNEINFVYDKKLKKDKDIVWVDYIFENVGESAAREFSIVMNEKKYFSIFDYPQRKSWLESKFIHYYVMYDKDEIRVGKTIRLRVYKHKDDEFSSFASAGLSIYFRDDYGNYWEQPFFNGSCKLYEPYKKTYKDYRDDILPDKALECFENPVLW
ncbi:MAG: hypothetical protein IKJ32_06145 [Clostridia bacterium]|nr:hypothetical protein [Clostridia bacterium]